MADQDLSDDVYNFIEKKKKFEDDGWNIIYIFECRFIAANAEIYGTKLMNLEDKLDNLSKQTPKEMKNFLKFAFLQKKFNHEVRSVKIYHAATSSGFCDGEIVYINEELSNDYRHENASIFIDQFKKIVSNKTTIPEKSLIILSKEPHHLISKSISKKEKSFAEASKRKGQKMISDYFQSTKKSNIELKKPPTSGGQDEIVVEKLLKKLRGEEVKIMWIPKNNLELDPCQYISVFLLNEISRYLIDSEDLTEIVKKTFDEFPNGMWEKSEKWVNYFENEYFEDDDE